MSLLLVFGKVERTLTQMLDPPEIDEDEKIFIDKVKFNQTQETVIISQVSKIIKRKV